MVVFVPAILFLQFDDAIQIRTTRSALSTEHFFSRKLRPRSQLTDHDADAVGAEIPKRGETNAYFPYCGLSSWKKAATGSSTVLRMMLHSKSDGEIWAAISESAWRRDATNLPDIIVLASKRLGSRGVRTF